MLWASSISMAILTHVRWYLLMISWSTRRQCICQNLLRSTNVFDRIRVYCGNWKFRINIRNSESIPFGVCMSRHFNFNRDVTRHSRWCLITGNCTYPFRIRKWSNISVYIYIANYRLHSILKGKRKINQKRLYSEYWFVLLKVSLGEV